MLLGALVLPGRRVIAAVLGGIAAIVALAFAANLAAAIGRLGFEAMLQRDAPHANRGRAFATFETRFQLAWAVAGLIPVVIAISGRSVRCSWSSPGRRPRLHAAAPAPTTPADRRAPSRDRRRGLSTDPGRTISR